MTNGEPEAETSEQTRAAKLLAESSFAFMAMVESVSPGEDASPIGTGDAGPGGDSRPYVVPVNLAYDATGGGLGRLYIHSGEGRKSVALTRNERVCVAATADESFDKGASPCADGFAFRSAIAEGRAVLLTDADQRERALRAIVEKYDPERTGLPFDEAVFARTLLYAIDIDTLTYKSRPLE